MAKQQFHNLRLGIFVMAGLMFLILLLYMIGKNKSMFGSTSTLKAHFKHVHGLVVGNNVRFSGIQAGTVKRIAFLNDTTIEVTMLIEEDMMGVIRKDAIVSIATDGLVGNKVLNIIPTGEPTPLAAEGDILHTQITINPDDMMETLQRTNEDIAIIATQLKQTLDRINQSPALWELLSDRSIPHNIRTAVAQFQHATANAKNMTDGLDDIVLHIRQGNGTLGSLLVDSSLAMEAEDVIQHIAAAGLVMDSILLSLDSMVIMVNSDLTTGQGVAGSLLRDTALANDLAISLDNIREGTDRFNLNMEALKHNFLFRGYFKKQERLNRKKARQDK